MQKLKIVIFPAWYPSCYDQMAGLPIQRLADALSKYADIAILYVHPEASMDQNLRIETSSDGFLEVRVFCKKRNNKVFFNTIKNGWYYVLGSIRGYIHLRKSYGKADIHHVQVLTRTGILPLALSFWENIPYVITEHWSRYLPEKNSYSGSLRKLIARVVVKNSIGLSAVSSALKNALSSYKLNHKNTEVIANAVNVREFVLGNDAAVSGCKIKFLHVSCFHDDAKNIKGIIKAANELDNEKYNFELNIAGAGRDFEEVKKFAENLLFNNVTLTFHGELIGSELVSLFQESTAFILFSNYETQGSVILESLACGVPVIGSNVGGIPEYVNDNNGILVEPGNIQDLKNAMLKFIHGENIVYDKKKLRAEVISKYSFEAISKKYIKFYQQALSIKND